MRSLLKTAAGKTRCYIKRRAEHSRSRPFAFRWNRNTQDDNSVLLAFATVTCNVFLKAGDGHSHLVRQASFLLPREFAQPHLASHAITAWRYSSSSLACSGHDIARVEGEHMKHLLKTSNSNLAVRRTKGKYNFRLLFAIRSCYHRGVPLHTLGKPCTWTNRYFFNF